MLLVRSSLRAIVFCSLMSLVLAGCGEIDTLFSEREKEKKKESTTTTSTSTTSTSTSTSTSSTSSTSTTTTSTSSSTTSSTTSSSTSTTTSTTNSTTSSTTTTTTSTTTSTTLAPPSKPTVANITPTGPANNNSPMISGTADANVTIEIYADSNCTQLAATGAPNGSGIFNIAVAVSDNIATSFYAQATSAGGDSPCSTTSVTYIEDSISPAAPVVTSTLPSLRSDQTNPLIYGTAEANAGVELYSDSNCQTSVATGISDSSGNYAVAINAPLDIVKSYYAKATDLAGNTSACSSTFVNYEAYSIASGVAFLKGTQTTASTTPNNFNQATGYSIKWSSSDFDSSYFNHSLTTNSHQIKTLVAGDYQVSINIPISGAVTAGSLRAEVRVNGVSHNSGLVQSSYIANASGHSESSNHLTLLLTDLNVDDLIDITVIRAGAAGTLAASGAATLYMEYMDSTRTIFSATATRTTNSTNLNQATAYGLQWAGSVKDSGFTHSDSTNSESITLDTAGTYILHLNIPLSGAVTNAATKALIQLNDLTVVGGEARQGYISNSSGHTQSSLHWSGVIRSTTDNQSLKIKTILEAATGTVTVSSGRTASIFIEKLSAADGLFCGQGTQLVSGSNFNPSASSSIKWVTNPLKDASLYTHSTTTNSHQVTVEQFGDYLVLYSDMPTATINRSNEIVSIAVNGIAQVGAQTKSHFIRNSAGHNESSATNVFLLRRLNAGDVITLSSQQEASTGTVTNQNSSLAILKKP